MLFCFVIWLIISTFAAAFEDVAVVIKAAGV